MTDKENNMTKYSEQFSLTNYKALLKELQHIGYKFTTYEEVQKEQPHIVLRHDIDNSLEYAVEIAKIEAQLNIKSYYFVLLRTSFYNLFSERNELLLREILNHGHVLGLHFDASIYFSSDSKLDTNNSAILADKANNECEILENFFHIKINHISFHRPVKNLLNHKGNLADRISTYNEKYFSGIGYCSDSGGDWKYGTPLDNENIKSKKAIQLLIHPIWWVERGESPKEKLDNFLMTHNRYQQDELKKNNKSYK